MISFIYLINYIIKESQSDFKRAKSIYSLESSPRVFDISELVKITKFNKSEIQFIYRDFKLVSKPFFFSIIISLLIERQAY